MTKKTENTIQLILSVAMVIFGMILITVSFFVDPRGEIHPSVLAAFGEILTFAGAIIGVDYNYKYKSRNKEENEE